jgi:hypothetical protein
MWTRVPNDDGEICTKDWERIKSSMATIIFLAFNMQLHGPKSIFRYVQSKTSILHIAFPINQFSSFKKDVGILRQIVIFKKKNTLI